RERRGRRGAASSGRVFGGQGPGAGGRGLAVLQRARGRPGALSWRWLPAPGAVGQTIDFRGLSCRRQAVRPFRRRKLAPQQQPPVVSRSARVPAWTVIEIAAFRADTHQALAPLAPARTRSDLRPAVAAPARRSGSRTLRAFDRAPGLRGSWPAHLPDPAPGPVAPTSRPRASRDRASRAPALLTLP